jgi:hypothetical protein
MLTGGIQKTSRGLKGDHMKRYFVWISDIERAIYEALSDKSKRVASNSDAIVKLFNRTAEVSEHYYATAAKMYELSKNWKNINMSSIFRNIERNERLWHGVGLIFTAFEKQKVLAAPPGSIIVTTFGIGGYSFEVITSKDPNYSEACHRLPGVA